MRPPIAPMAEIAVSGSISVYPIFRACSRPDAFPRLVNALLHPLHRLRRDRDVKSDDLSLKAREHQSQPLLRSHRLPHSIASLIAQSGAAWIVATVRNPIL